MSDITESLTQDVIADSLMDPESATPLPQGWGGWSTLREMETPAEESNFDANLSEAENAFGDSLVATEQELDEVFGGQDWRKPQESTAQAQQGQSPEPTTEDIQQGMEKLDAFIEEQNLNDPASAKTFSEDFCSAFGTTSYEAGVDTKSLGQVMSKVAVSAVNAWEQAHGDPSKLPPVSPVAAAAFTREFLRAWNVDSRTVEVNSQQLAQTVFAGALNFIDTYQRLGGRVQNLEQLNSPEMAEHFLGNFLRSFGVETPVDRTTALKVADAAGKYLLGFLGKLGQIPQREQTRPARQSSKSSGRKSSHPRPQMRTNRDIFSDDVLDHYHSLHGRL